jgi:hypothetical protein
METVESVRAHALLQNLLDVDKETSIPYQI